MIKLRGRHPLRSVIFEENYRIETGVSYTALDESFPVVHGFFFFVSKGGRYTFVGVQVSLARSRHTNTEAFSGLVNELKSFSNWREISEKLTWEIIYVHQEDRKGVADVQNCEVTGEARMKRIRTQSDSTNCPHEDRRGVNKANALWKMFFFSVPSSGGKECDSHFVFFRCDGLQCEYLTDTSSLIMSSYQHHLF